MQPNHRRGFFVFTFAKVEFVNDPLNGIATRSTHHFTSDPQRIPQKTFLCLKYLTRIKSFLYCL